ncbi:MAG: aldo/keto reductase [Gemmatimonadetes bacterium]|nr:aldo/keto reductase [Gemmatimonadota bacterium]
MITRLLGPGAPAVSAIGFGGMPLSIAGRPPEDRAIRAVHAALEAGMTLIDTADVYCLDDNDIGHNERLIAKALKQWTGNKEGIVVATKGGLTRPGGSWERVNDPAHLRKACDRSLKALGVERIDLYQLHAPLPGSSIAETAEVLAELKTAGKIRWVGLSNVSVSEIEQARKVVDVATVQNRLSPFFRESLEPGFLREPSVVEHCRTQGVGFLAYSPVGGGRLNLKLPGLPVIATIAKRHNATPHSVVLAWVLAQGPTVIPIPGGRTVEHVKDAAGAADLDLTPAELEEIAKTQFSRA